MRRYNRKPISLVGSKTSGKTVYIVTLIRELLRGEITNTYNIVTQFLSVPSMKKYQELERELFVNRHLPRSTKGIAINSELKQPFILEISSKENRVPLILFDSAGEDMFDPNTMVASVKYIVNSGNLIILLDLLTDRDILQKLDLLNEKTEKMFLEDSIPPQNFINNIYLGFRNIGMLSPSGKIDKPVAIVIPKIDIYREKGLLTEDNPIFALKDKYKKVGLCKEDLDILHNEVKNLFKILGMGHLDILINSVFSNYRYFAVSSLGHNPEGDKITKPIEPIRVGEPLLWLLSEDNLVEIKRCS